MIKRLIYFFILTLTSIGANAQINAEQVLNIGRNVLSMDDYMLSIHYFNLAANAKPYMAEPYYYRALAKLMLEDYKGAEQDAGMALDRNKFLTEAYRVRGFARMKLELDSLALEDFNVGLTYKPIDKYFLYYKVAGEAELKHYSQAMQTLTTLLRYYPGFEGAYSQRARLNILQNDTTAALADIDTALLKDKNDHYPYLLRAEIAVNRKQWNLASRDLDEAIKLLPTEKDLYLNRAYVRYNDDDYFGAMSDYNYLLELEPDNLAARYNRALLLYEVRDLRRSVNDFNEVLKLQPENFHALYARALINFDLHHWRDAIGDLQKIVAKYPRFHQGYYALAHAYSQSGNMNKAIENYNKAETLVRQYVSNPTRNPLDKPTISQGVANTHADRQQEGESDSEVMERFNQLVTVSATENQGSMTFQEAIKGKVQDRSMRVEPVALFALTPFDSHTELRPVSNFLRELSDYNAAHYAPWRLYIGPLGAAATEQEDIERMFSMANRLSEKIGNEKDNPRPVDYFNRGVAYTILKDFTSAIADFDSTLNLTEDMTLAYLGRAVAYVQRAAMLRHKNTAADKGQSQLENAEAAHDLQMAVNDLDKSLQLNPGLVYAWYNKGGIYYELGDYTSALECYNQALKLRPDFAEALYNRGLTYLSLGNKESGRADLSRSGELGILPSYSLLKRMQ